MIDREFYTLEKMTSLVDSILSKEGDIGSCLCACSRPDLQADEDAIKDPNSFRGRYKQGKMLGEGAFSIVTVGESRETGKIYAVKVINKDKLNEEDELALKDEINILNELRHDNIIRLYEVYDETKNYYLVTEYMMGGELFDRMVQKKTYNEKEARDVSKTLFGAISFCHDKHVVHRDLKPENLLLMQKDDTHLKIADFGFAKKMIKDQYLKTQCGTPSYVAPEILEGTPYGSQVDNWSLGVILFILLGGYRPFSEPKRKNLFRKIRKADYKFDDKYWTKVSTQSQHLIRRLLTLDSRQRITSKQALTHPWILGNDDELSRKDLSMNLQNFKEFNLQRKFKAAVSAVKFVNKIESLGANFKEDI